MPHNLVIVESPSKAKTIGKYLGPGYEVLASFGHVRDLPSKDGSVRPDEDFAMDWELGDRAAKPVREILAAAKGADAIYLATDPDREGEAISWHIEQLLNEKKLNKGREIHRVTFNEITKPAIQAAFKKPRQVDAELVEAYLARRALDYLVGFNLSPILWRKLPGARSAGRVQSVALRLICERETEIEKFRAEEYWTIEATLAAPDGTTFAARLTHWEGKKLEKFSITQRAEAEAIAAKLANQNFTVSSQTRKELRRHPQPPFITSSLQIDAARKLGFGAQHAMRLAQKLYEGVDIGGETVGLITYMRTDGVQLSEEAIASCRSMIDQLYGQDYLPAAPRIYTSKAKNAQEAHEAIRPTDLHRSPEKMKKYLDGEMLELYDLIWKRTLAAQMESAILDQTAIDFSGPNNVTLRASGSVIKFEGFLKVYAEGRDEPAEDDDENRRLPSLKDGTVCKAPEIRPEQHFTQPPPRYTEATLVKALEELGIGRPSTYASIINVLQERSYVVLDKKRFIPNDRGRIVTSFLQNFFHKYVEYDFTAHLEEQLDDVSGGRLNWKKLLRDFWGDFSGAIDSAKPLTITQVIDVLDAELEAHLFPPRADGSDPRKCPQDGGRLGLKLGRFGAFIGCSNYPECEYKRPMSVGEGGANGDDNGAAGPRILGTHPDTGENIEVKIGPYGPYVEMPGPEGKPKRASLPRGEKIADVTLEKAVDLLLLPKDLGIFPETGEKILANIGRFGPYVQAGKIYASVPKSEDILEVGLNRAIALLMDKKAKMAPLRILGEHPEGGEIGVYSGRFSPVVRHGDREANLTRVIVIDDLTLEEAIKLLAEKGRARLGSKTKGGKKAATKKPATKTAAKVAGKKPTRAKK